MGIIYNKQITKMISSQFGGFKGNKMIDFDNATFLKLAEIPVVEGHEMVCELLVENETVKKAFRTVRDYIVFTNKRLITVNVQGISGNKIDFSSLPYCNIQAFSCETASSFDLDCELAFWFAGLGMVRLELASSTDIQEICKLISDKVLL